MNRRNFILGLGTAATLSGAASVTSAALQGAVEGGADFRVLSAQQLTVTRNGDILAPSGNEVNNSLTGYVNTSDPYVDGDNGGEGSLNFTGSGSSSLNSTESPVLTVDSGNNSELNMSLATPNDNSTALNRNASYGGDPPYNATGTASGTAPLEVVNNGAAGARVGVEYTYGTDVGSGADQISESTVNDLFTFGIGGTQISPDTADDNGDFGPNAPAGYVEVGSGNTAEVDLDINYNSNIEETLRNNLSSGFGASGDNLSLLDTVYFGVDDTQN